MSTHMETSSPAASSKADVPTGIAGVRLAAGDLVVCLANSIDRPFGKGVTGRISGFARLSSYHPREVWVDGVGWLWECDVARVVGA